MAIRPPADLYAEQEVNDTVAGASSSVCTKHKLEVLRAKVCLSRLQEIQCQAQLKETINEGRVT